MSGNEFRAERLSNSAAIRLNAGVETVFPLFTPIEERKWAEGWEPCILYPADQRFSADMVFQTRATNQEESFFTWQMVEYKPDIFQLKYHVFTPNRTWLIAIACQPVTEVLSTASITYTYTALTPLGNQLNAKAIAQVFANQLEDWQSALNHYLANGKPLTINTTDQS